MVQYWTVATAQGDGSALSNTTTPTSLLPGEAKIPLQGGALWFKGQKLRVLAHGRMSTVVTSPGTFQFTFKLGSVIVADGVAMTLSTTAKTNVAWELAWDMTVRAVGTSTTANLIHQGRFTSEAAGATTVAGEAKSIMMPQSAPAVGTGFDSTALAIPDLFGTWSSASASNSITLHGYEFMIQP